MEFYVKGLSTEFKRRYVERLDCIEGAIGVLGELIMENMDKKKRKEELEEKEYVFNNDNFNEIYKAVLRVVNKEESRGYSEHRTMLDRVDRALDKLTEDVRVEVRKIGEEKQKSMIGPHHSDKNYMPPVYHLPFYIPEVKVG